MTIPTSGDFPKSLDTDTNLFLVHDSLRVRLADDYMPGDSSITVEGDPLVMANFPPTGLITLTEQCSDIDRRAISFYYGSRTSTTFDELQKLDGFEDNVKPKRLTNVTMNVMAEHHNTLKDALISVERFVGTRYSSDTDTITGRISRLEKLVLPPKAWFIADKQYGLAPLKVVFTNQSFRVGEGIITQLWDFGDGQTLEIVTNGIAEYLSKSTQSHSYALPGTYSVTLTVINSHGRSSVRFDSMIAARNKAPDPAVIEIVPTTSQNYKNGVIRSVVNSTVDIRVPEGVNTSRGGPVAYSLAGEELNSLGSPVDAIKEWTWNLGDDLAHSNSRFAKASYSLGGYYDAVLRVDTRLGSYRITKYSKSIDIVEQTNLWMFGHTTLNRDGSGEVQAYEFGLASETFKTLGNQKLAVTRSNGFLSNSPFSYGSTNPDGTELDNPPYFEGTYKRAKKEFGRNVEFRSSGSASSGDRGNSLLFWATGGAARDENKVAVRKYNAFDDNYESLSDITGRPWNWVALHGPGKTYFLFGQNGTYPNRNPSFPQRLDYELLTQSSLAPSTLDGNSFENGASELLEHPSYYDQSGVATNGHFAVYRSAWKDQTGYIMRNSSVNEFFRLGDFYKTKGSIAEPFGTITKLPNVTGSVKVEGELVALSSGIFMFSNSGEICAWNDTSLTWEVGRVSSSSLSFRSVQDASASNFDDRSNTLLAASDGDRAVYLSYDYSDKTFVKFNGTDLTFSAARVRPFKTQFKMGIY